MTQAANAPETLAIFGGAFDPPHVGHVLAVHYVLLTSGASRVLVIPCAEHPFGKRQESFAARLAMCRLAFAHLGDAVEILDIEGERKGPSYTIDTVRELMRRRPNVRLELVVGSDSLDDLERWHEIDELRRLAPFRVLSRLEEGETPHSPNAEVLFCLPRVSSTTVREMLEKGGDVSSRVPAAVLDYIRRFDLYR